MKRHATPMFDGDLLRRLREGKGWTLRQLAMRARVSSSSLCRAEAGDGELAFGSAVAIAAAFEINVGAFAKSGRQGKERP